MQDEPIRDIGPPAEGERLHWADLAEGVRAALEERLGGPVIGDRTQPSGFSPGLASILTLVDGRRVFVKAVSASANPFSPVMHRREAGIAAALPASAPVPRFLWSYDDGEWVALAFEPIDGRPPLLPWNREELGRVLDTVRDLSRSLTPSPLDAPSIRERLGRGFMGWRSFAEQKTGAGRPIEPDPWAGRYLDRLVDLERRWEDAATGVTLLHCDLRADNLLLTEDLVYIVDWPHACVGAGWIDLVGMLPSVAMQGGPSPWEVFDDHPLSAGADPDSVNAVLAAVAGFFEWLSRQPPEPGLAAVRAFQAAQAREALKWLRHRTGWR